MRTDEENTLKLLDDLPVAQTNSDEDKFQHKVYAEILRDIFLSNRPGISVGLFGKWGQGKSTVVNLLRQCLPEGVRTVVFNAWKARGDSVRRQLLLTILEEINPEKAKELKKFAGLELAYSLIRSEFKDAKGQDRAVWQITKDFAFNSEVRTPFLASVASILAIVVLGLLALNSPYKDIYSVVQGVLLIPVVGGLFIYVARTVRQRYSGILGISEPVSESQKLRYPEQFRDVFIEEVVSFLKRNPKTTLLIVIDDLDRCEPVTVVEALSAIRQFSDPSLISKKTGCSVRGCQFLLPCDEDQVVLALEADGHNAGSDAGRYHDYQSEELLRKFFDVVVRMDKFLPDDLTTYAAGIAGTVDLDKTAAKELIDMVNPTNPRQIKKLLNAYKLVNTKLKRSQDRGLLPADKAMPELERTLMVLVALRETVPSAYKTICGQPSLLQEYTDLDKNNHEEARVLKELSAALGILNRAGRVSPITAEYLVTGKYEPELRGLEEGGPFALALKRQDSDAFKESLEKSDVNARESLRKFTLNKVKQISTVSRLRGDLSLFAHYGSTSSDHAKFIAPCLGACLYHSDLLSQAVRDFAHFDRIEMVLPTLDEDAKQKLFDTVLSIFESNADRSDRELAFLLAVCKLMKPELQNRFRNSLKKVIAEQEKGDQVVLRRLFHSLPSDKTKCRGFAPDVGVTLAAEREWTDDHDKDTKTEPEKWPRSQLIPVLVGNHKDAAKRCLLSMFGPNGQLANPTQLLNAAVGIKPALRAVCELTKVVEAEHASELFEYFQKWLNPQGDVQGAKIILDALDPMMFSLEEGQLQSLGDYLANLLWNRPEDSWLCDYAGKKPGGRTKETNWAILCKRIFLRFSNNLQGQPTLSEQHMQLLGKMSEYKWPVGEKADELLAVKLKQLPNGTTQQGKKWLSAIVPLMGDERPKSSEAIRELLRNRQSINEALQAGKTVLWIKQIDPEDATVIAHMCVNLGNQLPTYDDALSSLMGIKGSARIVELCVDLLKDDQNWLKEQVQLLTLMGKSLSVAEKAVQQAFQRKVKLLIISDDDVTVIVGLSVLKECVEIDSAVMKEVKLRAKSENDQIRELAETVRAKKTFS